MKVIHILHSLKFSGAEIMYVDAASEFQKKGCQLTVMATADELGEYAPNFEKSGFEVVHFPMPPLNHPIKLRIYYRTIIKFLKQGNYDVVHIHSSGARFVFAFCAWRANVKSVYTFHNVFKSRLVSLYYHILQRMIIKSIFNCEFQTISDSVYDNELKRYGNKTVKVYNWYGNERYYPATESEKTIEREKLGINKNTLVLISVGGCSIVKRHSDILKAMSLVVNTIEDVLYLHLGTGCTEDEEIQLAENLNLSSKIRFLGNQEDVRKYLIVSDIYLMTSRFEGISITTIEAMACQIPSILYDVPGLRDFNKTGYNSVLIPENYKLLAENIIKLNNSKELNIMALNAKKTVNELYHLQTNADKIYNLYL